MATKSPYGGGTLGDFARAVDELVDDLLITRWRESRHRTGESPRVNDRGAHYEVRIVAGAVDARATEIEVSELRLIVRFPGPSGTVEHSLSFGHPVECEAVSAKWDNGVLAIVLPKKRGRRVIVE